MTKWIEGSNHTLLNLDEVLSIKIQQEMEGSYPNRKPTGKYFIKTYGTHRNKWGNAEVTMFTENKQQCEARMEYLQSKLGLTGHDRINIG